MYICCRFVDGHLNNNFVILKIKANSVMNVRLINEVSNISCYEYV